MIGGGEELVAFFDTDDDALLLEDNDDDDLTVPGLSIGAAAVSILTGDELMTVMTGGFVASMLGLSSDVSNSDVSPMSSGSVLEDTEDEGDALTETVVVVVVVVVKMLDSNSGAAESEKKQETKRSRSMARAMRRQNKVVLRLEKFLFAAATTDCAITVSIKNVAERRRRAFLW
jgi:hypothetical protein